MDLIKDFINSIIEKTISKFLTTEVRMMGWIRKEYLATSQSFVLWDDAQNCLPGNAIDSAANSQTGIVYCFCLAAFLGYFNWSSVMNDSMLFMAMNQKSDEAIQWVWNHLSEAGLNVVRTYNLKDVQSAHLKCVCPYHGTERCDCQIVILLIYKGNLTPLSLVAYGHDDQTWFYLVNSPQQVADPRLKSAIRQTLMTPASGIFSRSVSRVAG